ncbi:MAG: hypothetical protein ACRET5_18445, partial [Steroidobacteraceae bacterium]
PLSAEIGGAPGEGPVWSDPRGKVRRDDVVFVGGCTAGLLLTDSAAEGSATKDVDAIVEVATLRQYYELQSRHIHCR